MLLRAFGLDPASAGARHAVRLVRERCRWEHDGEPFFAGEVEPCINGRVVAIGGYFGEDVRGVVDRLLGEQMSDGGGTASRRTDRREGRSTPQSTCWRVCWSTSERWGASPT